MRAEGEGEGKVLARDLADSWLAFDMLANRKSMILAYPSKLAPKLASSLVKVDNHPTLRDYLPGVLRANDTMIGILSRLVIWLQPGQWMLTDTF